MVKIQHWRLIIKQMELKFDDFCIDTNYIINSRWRRVNIRAAPSDKPNDHGTITAFKNTNFRISNMEQLDKIMGGQTFDSNK